MYKVSFCTLSTSHPEKNLTYNSLIIIKYLGKT
jgi:hypothetical protein